VRVPVGLLFFYTQFVWQGPVARLGMDGGKKVNAVKFYVIFDRIDSFLFKIFTMYLHSQFHAGYVPF
jgi:hypothetical protein